MPTLDDLGHSAHAGVTGAGSAAQGGLRKKIGPLEVWQYAAALVGVVLAYAAYRISANGASTGTSTTAPTASETGGYVGGGDSGSSVQDELGQIQAELQAQSAASTATPAATTPTVSSDVANLYATIGTSAADIDPGGNQYWQSDIDVNGLASALAAIDNSAQGQAFGNANPLAYVQAQYNALEPGNPDEAAGAAGSSYWVGQVESVGAGREAQEFAASVEAAQTGNPKASVPNNPVKT